MKILAKNTLETTDTIVQDPPPLHLKHQAIFMVPYEPFDGWYSSESGTGTDVRYLSLGLAQWRADDETDELSLKIWRKPEGRWSRQSEEIPTHRTVDLCILLTKALYQPESRVNDDLLIRAGTFERQTEDMIPLRLGHIPKVFFEGVPGESDMPENDRLKSHLRQLRDELNKAELD
jgi:hypothetical protein